jgi:predicted ATPase
MSRPSSLAEILQQLMAAHGYALERLAHDTGVPKATLHHWLSGRVVRPNYWEGLLAIADRLSLRRVETNALLRAAGQPPLDVLAGQVHTDEHRRLIERWTRSAPNNLPGQLTSFVGREREVEQYGCLLCAADVRLLTLVGLGGSGKTRLALRVAGELQDAFPGGIYFVPLVTVRDPEMVIPTIARTLEIGDVRGMPAADRLATFLAGRELLLVLDNVEQVADAGPALVRLLRRAPGVKVLATSRSPLHVSGEHARPVQPFGLPEPGTPFKALTHNPAIQLFVARAQAANPDFALTRKTAPSVLDVCRRLDGLPLAIELAAARMRSYRPAELLDRFASRLELAEDGPRDAEDRQRTLHATIAWSYELLSAHEQTFFARLAVFASGWQESDAFAICDLPDPQPSLGLESLLGVSLIERAIDAGEPPRFRMLETIREFAAERLAASGEEAALRDRHARHFLAVAETAERYMPAVRQQDWLERIDREHHNVRAALAWALTRPNPELAARLAAALWPYWHEYSHIYEGSSWVSAVLDLSADGDDLAPALRAELYTATLTLAFGLADYERARTYAAAALPLWEQLDDGHGQALVLHELGWTYYALGDMERAIDYFARAAERWRAIEHVMGLAHGLDTLGFALATSGRFVEAEGPLEESARIFTQRGDRLGLARSYAERGMSALLQGHLADAIGLLERSVALSRETSNNFILPAALFYLGMARCFAGELDLALAALAESLDHREHNGDKLGLSLTLLGFAAVAHRQGQLDRAARLSGAALMLQAAQHITMAPTVQVIYEREIQTVRDQLDPTTFATAFTDGQTMSAAMAVAYAREALSR